MHKLCIVGAGAIGGFIGTRLAALAQQRPDLHVSALARGATLQALRTHGWRMNTAQGLQQVPANANRFSDNAADLGPQDLVIIAVKGQALTQVAQQIGPLLTPDTIVLPAMNGVPWWFCAGQPGWEHVPLQSVDPGGVIARAIPLAQVLGCVVHASTSTPEPGLVQHKMGQGLIVGEPDGGGNNGGKSGSKSTRAQQVVDLLAAAGFDASLSARIRYDIWYKLWGNLTMNPVSAITGATIDRLLADPQVRAFCSDAMREASVIGARIGCPIDQDPEARHAVTAKLGAFKTSMLQDVEAGRAIELDAIVGAVFEISQRLGLATPNINALLGLTRVMAQVRGLY